MINHQYGSVFFYAYQHVVKDIQRVLSPIPKNWGKHMKWPKWEAMERSFHQNQSSENKQ